MQLNGGPMSVEKTIKEFYDKVGKGNGPYAEGINRFAPTAPTSKLIQIARDRKAERILDIGCGMGISIIDMANPFLFISSPIIIITFSKKKNYSFL